MKMRVVRDRDGNVISIMEDAQDDLSVDIELEDGQDVEVVEVADDEMSDLDALFKRLKR
jgi:hypothetical protein